VSPSSFQRWLGRQDRAEPVLGVLRRWVEADPAWPRGVGERARIERHLRRANAPEEVTAAFASAWPLYARTCLGEVGES
jgi:hypothetical protein